MSDFWTMLLGGVIGSLSASLTLLFLRLWATREKRYDR